MAHHEENWAKEFPVAVTVTDARGTIIEMNDRSIETFLDDGGANLIGTSVFDCHPEPSRTKTLALYESKAPNHYTISKKGVKKIIHQIPWTKGGAFAGFVELSIPIPEDLPHFNRD